MIDLIWYATGLMMAGGASYAYSRTGDGLHPAVIITPPMLLMYCIWPLSLNADGGLERFFSEQQIEYVATLYFLALACLYLGLVKEPRELRLTQLRRLNMWAFNLSAPTRRKLYTLSLLLGALAILAYLYTIYNVGGFENAYGRAKGGGRAPSGYIAESILS